MGVLFHRHVAIAAIVGLVVGVIVGWSMHVAFAPSIGWSRRSPYLPGPHLAAYLVPRCRAHASSCDR